MKKAEICSQALANARGNQSLMNYVPIIEGFMARGIPEDQIRPRENVFTYNAWLALGRQVKRGEHGVKVVTFIVCDDKKKEGQTYRRPWTTTVFHITQTEVIPSGEKIREYFALDATTDTNGESAADVPELDATGDNRPFAGGAL